MTTVHWPTARAELLAELTASQRALMEQFKASYQGAGDGAVPTPKQGSGAGDPPGPGTAVITMKQAVAEQPPVWLVGLQKELGAAWSAGPKNQIVEFGADGRLKVSATPAHVIMGRSALLAPIESPVNSVYKGLPLGSILLGGISAYVVGSVIDRKWPHTPKTDGTVTLNMTNLAIKSGAALALATFGTRVFSTTGALIAAGIFVVEVAVDLLGKRLDDIILWLKKQLDKIFKPAAPAASRFSNNDAAALAAGGRFYPALSSGANVLAGTREYVASRQDMGALPNGESLAFS